jgi:hypothetical protein
MRPGRVKVARENDFPVAACQVLVGAILTAIVWLLLREPNGGYNRGIMPRVGEFCPSNIARLVLGVVIVVTLVVAVGIWLFHSPGHATSIDQPTHTAKPLSK